MIGIFKVIKQSDGSYNGKSGRVYQDRLILQDQCVDNPLDIQPQMELKDDLLSKYGDGKLKGKTIKVGVDEFRVMGSRTSINGTILEVLKAS